MIAFNKEELRVIAYDCRKATFLIEKKQGGSITPREKLELQLHLDGCSICQTYEKQSLLISAFTKNLFSNLRETQNGLDENLKKHLHELINEKLNKNK